MSAAPKKRNTWNVPDPDKILLEGSVTRRKVEAHKALHGLPTLAKSLEELVAAGYDKLNSNGL